MSHIPQTLNVKQSLQVLRRIDRLKASAMKKKQQLSTQNLVDHVNREAEIFDSVDHTSDEPINVFTIKEQRHSKDFESDHGNINEDEIENILSPPFLPESPPPLDPNDITYTPTDDEHTSSVKKLALSALYGLILRGGDLVGAYLVTPGSKEFMLCILTLVI